jgi:hypothetical protein
MRQLMENCARSGQWPSVIYFTGRTGLMRESACIAEYV